MKSANFEVRNGRIVMTEEGMLRYSQGKSASGTNAAIDLQTVHQNSTTTKPLTQLKTLVGKIMSGDLKVDDQVIAKASETLNKAQMIAKPADKSLLKHIVDGLASGDFKCDEKTIQGVAETLNKAQKLDKFNHEGNQE